MWRFFPDSTSTGLVLHGSHHWVLVFMAMAIAMLASFTALAVAERMRVSELGRARGLWLAVGAVSMGIGIWAMHFVGMLSWHIEIPIAFDTVTTLVSVVPAIGASAAALLLLSTPDRTRYSVILGGLAMAAGIGTMHYVGMEALRMNARLYYRPAEFALSIIVAFALATFSLWRHTSAASLRVSPTALRWKRAVILGGAVTAMHFIAMHAAVVVADPSLPRPSSVLPDATLVVVVTSAVAILVSLTLVATRADRRLTDLSTQLSAGHARLQAVLNSIADGVLTFDASGVIQEANPAAEQMFGVERYGLTGRCITSFFPSLEHGELTPGSLEVYNGHPSSRRVETTAERVSGERFLVEVVVSDIGLTERALFSGVVRDITERVESERRLHQHVSEIEAARAQLQSHAEQLADARDRAEEAARAKSEFLATMSHELRTPMNGVLGMAQLLLHTTLTDEQAGRVRVLQRSSEALLRIINDVLDFSKIEAGKLHIDSEPFDLLTLVEEVRETVAAAADIVGLSLTIEVDPACPRWVLGDGGRVRQVLLNLVGNAIKFTDQGSVTIAARVVRPSDGSPDEHVIALSVTDTGIGLAEETIERLFAPFTQADSSATRKRGGTGLGLVISRRLAEMMRGTLTVESKLGTGSSFCLSLPLPPTDPPPAPRAPLPSALDLASLRPSSGEPARVPHVLVAEDNSINQIVVVALLSHLGCTVDVAADGREAVRRWSAGSYDLILMDCQMPEMDGLEATRAIREVESSGSRIPIVALTANAMAEDRAACIAAGMDDHIAKPVTEQSLLDALNFARRGRRRR